MSDHADPRVSLVLDDHSLRGRFEQALHDGGLEIAHEDARPSQVDAGSVQPEVVVAIGKLSNAAGTSVVGSLRASRSPATKLVVCTEKAGRRELRQAIDEGLDGLVWERNIETSLAPTIRAVLAGQLVIPRELRRRLETPNLSTREKQVLSLVVMGLSNNEIAQRLYIGQTTVKTHLASVFRKLGVSSRAEAARLIADPDEGLGTGILRITEKDSNDAGDATGSIARASAGSPPG